MNINDIIDPDRIACDIHASSKKRALEKLSDIIVSNPNTSLSSQDICDSLIARERLGSTGIGYGVAIPHGRVKNMDKAVAAFVQLHEGIDFDASDNQSVDLLFALLVPEHSTEEHLQILSKLAEMFSDEKVREQLRATKDKRKVYELLRDWNKPN